MLGEFLSRLAVALPLVCLLAVVVLLAVRRGWVRLPGLPRFAMPGFSAPGFSLALPSLGIGGTATGSSAAPGASPPPKPLEVAVVRALTPAARLAVVRFGGRELLIGVSPQQLVLLASSTPAPDPAARSIEEPARCLP
jgi:hypothetical protein